MTRAVACRILLVLSCGWAMSDPAWAAKKSRSPIASNIKQLQISPQELRIRVRALIRPSLGSLEQAADAMLGETSDPAIRRGVLRLKIETTTTLLSAMLRTDPVLALADSWGYVLQVKALLGTPEAKERFGEFAGRASGAMAEIEAGFREFAASLQEDFPAEEFEAKVRGWAERHPIEGALYRRPSVDTAVAKALATESGGGAFAALGNLDETTADVMTRMDLYTMYLPRLARWEGELAVDDLAGGIDSRAIVGEIERLSHAIDAIAAVAGDAPALVDRERTAVLEAVRQERLAATKDVQGERAAVLAALHQERVESLAEIEAIVQRLLDRSKGPLNDAVRGDLKEFVDMVEQMRRSLIDDSGTRLDEVVDHAFFKAVELLLIVAALGALGIVLNARLQRR